MQPSERLKAFRHQKDLTQTQLAESIGMKQTQIRDIEIGKVKVSVEMALQIEKKFGLNMRWLLTGDGDMFLYQPPQSGACMVAEPHPPYSAGGTGDDLIDKVVMMMRNAPEEVRREILRCAEERTLIADMLAERRSRAAG